MTSGSALLLRPNYRYGRKTRKFFDGHIISAGFSYRLDRLKHRASKIRGPPVNVYNMFNAVI
jgi:hypothetical protein